MSTNAASYGNIPRFEDLQPIGPSDDECIKEVREVLAKHGKLNRFSLSLLHEHFEMAEDEVLKEDCDQETRSLTLKAVKEASLTDQSIIGTELNMETGRIIRKCSFGKCD
jgi:hypothetical protein